jgi:hypothetical protein
MKQAFIALFCGLLFGLGLAVSGMTNPNKVLGFLDLTGDWDASLLLVLGGAVSVTAICFHFVLRQTKPICNDIFHLPKQTHIDARLIIGSILFGIGWGISGYCPGPGIALLAAPSLETALFLPAMLLGWVLHAVIFHRKN